MAGIDELRSPLFFESTRVWRCYLGGRLLGEFLGNEAAADGYFPEDWLASVTRAENGERRQSPDEGLSRVEGTGRPFAEIVRDHPREALGPRHAEGLGVLCKFLDSAIRLPIQCHPDREFARRHFDSAYGKTESWLILATREIGGEKPYVLLGFKPEATREEFRRAVTAQDVPAMVGCLHKFPVEPGDGFFIPGRVPHAIGPGVMLLEVQEPTDLVIQPELKVGEITLTEGQMWGGLDHDTGFDCFEYQGRSPQELLGRLSLRAATVADYPNATLASVIGRDRTDCFKVDRLTLRGDFELAYEAPWYLGIVTAGEGRLVGRTERPFRRGDRFFVSNQIDRLRYRPTGAAPAELYIVSGGSR